MSSRGLDLPRLYLRSALVGGAVGLLTADAVAFWRALLVALFLLVAFILTDQIGERS